MIAKYRRPLVAWFARCDLFERQMLRTTRTIQRTICVVTLFLVASFGLAQGYEKARRERIQSKCQSLCLIISEPNVSNEITPEYLSTLETRLRLPEAAAINARLMPYKVIRDAVFANSAGNGVYPIPKGRTIEDADPLLAELISTQGFQSACPKEDLEARNGIIVTRTLLDILSAVSQTASQLTPDHVPQALLLSTRLAGLQSVRVLGVTEERLLQGYFYLVPASYYEDFRASWNSLPWLKIRTGVLPVDSPLSDARFTAAFSKKYSDALKESALVGRVDRINFGDGYAWQFSQLGAEADPAKLSRDEWLKRLEPIKQWIRDENVQVPATFGDIGNTEQADPEVLGFPYDDLHLYVSEVDNLRPAFHHVSDAFTPSVPVSEDKIHLAEDIAATTQTVVMLLWIVAGLLALIAALNLSTLLVLRAERQTTEIGMLKAMGMDLPLLRQIHVWEGFLLWRRAAPTGLVMGVIAGFAIAEGACFLFNDPYRLRFVVPIPIAISVTLISWPLCIFAILAANRRAHHSSPARCLAESI